MPLSPDAIASLGNLPIKARHIVEGALTGLHRAEWRGTSVEFAQHKEYAPGDDIRHLDWKAYGKVDRYVIKQYEQESQMTAHLVLDASASMAFAGGAVSKLAYAVHLIAALAHLLVRQRDRVGLTLFGDRAVHDADRVPPRSRPNHAADVYAALERVLERGAQGHDGATRSLERIAETSERRRALVLIITDLLGDDTDAIDVLRQLRVRGHDPVLFHVLDPHELTFPYSGLTRFDSLEDKRRFIVDPEHVRERYLAAMQAFLKRVRDACATDGIEYHHVVTDTPIERTLLDFTSSRTRLLGPRKAWTF